MNDNSFTCVVICIGPVWCFSEKDVAVWYGADQGLSKV